jgi:elongation factor G
MSKEEMCLMAYRTDKLRNIGLISHSGAGKTSLGDAMLYVSGAVKRLGKVDDGTSVFDHDPEEVRRKTTITSSVAPCKWKDAKINIVDTPGYFDFVGEVKSSLSVVDAAIVVVCAASGVEVGTENVWGYAEENDLPKCVFVNKMDRENANFARVYQSLRDHFGDRVSPVIIPIGSENSFRGVIDLVKMKAYIYDGGTAKEQDIPDDLQDEAISYRESLIENVAETDDELVMKYLEGDELTTDEVAIGLRKGTIDGSIIPVFCGSVPKSIGIDKLLDGIVEYIPSPLDIPPITATSKKTGETIQVKPTDSFFSAQVFKTTADPYVGKLTLFRVYSGSLSSDSSTYNASKDAMERIGQIFVMNGKEQIAVESVNAGDMAAVAKVQVTGTGDTLCDKDSALIFAPIEFPESTLFMAVQPKTKGDEEKIGSGLARLVEEDPTFRCEKNAETGQMLIYGMGELHLDIITSRLAKKFGVDVDLSTPTIPYRETIKGTTQVEGKHKKQSGGRGQFGHVFLELSPLQAGEEFEFVDKIFGGAVPRQYIPAVEKGVRETMQKGVLAGYPVVDVRVALYDGSYHSVDSSEMAFKIAASMAFKKGMLDAKPVLLEPIMKVSVTVPEEYMGDIMGDLNKKRGRILGMEPVEGKQVITAEAPLSEMFRYAIDLRSMTQGRGVFTMEFTRYEEVPEHLTQAIIEAAARDEE